MVSTFSSTCKSFSIAGAIALLVCGGRNALAQSGAPNPGVLEHEAVTPPLLFREVWQQPPHTGPLNDENRRITPQAVTNGDLELRLYGTDARNIQVTEHNGVPDLWTGFATSPVALTLRHKNAYLDLTGLTRMRWRTRTENLHVLHPVVKLADGTYIVARRAVETNGEFLSVDLSFNDLKWFKLDPEKVLPSVEVKNPDLTKVDEIGMAFLAPGGGHGTASSINLSDVEVYAKAVPR